MRSERIDFLSKMGAHRALPLVNDDGAPKPKPGRPRMTRPAAAHPSRYRFKFEKLGPSALLGHLDLVRALPRVMRRIGVPIAYSQGFHPRPDLCFSPALSLGVMSLSEYVDIKLLCDLDPPSTIAEMNASADEGLTFTAGARLGPDDAGISKIVSGARYLIAFARSAVADRGGEQWLRDGIARFLQAPECKVRREIEGLAKYVDVRSFVNSARLGSDDARAEARRAGLLGDLLLIDVDVKILGSGGVKTNEMVQAFTAASDVPHRAVRTALYGERAGISLDPLNLVALRRAKGEAPRVSAQ
jgi:radical SAM-linked protein